MGEFITAIMSTVTGAALWDTLAPAAPLVGALMLFGFGYFVLRRAIKGGSTGKARI